VGTVIGFLLAFLDVVISGSSVDSVLTGTYVPILAADIIAVVILVPILVYAWEPLKEQIGR
jgi:hypothetical protein